MAKVRAFTIQEMTVVLLITSIVTGMAFSVLHLVQRQMGAIEGIYGAKMEIDKLRQSLWIDFHTYSRVYFDPESESLYFENEMGTKRYEFGDGRITAERDTFGIRLESRAFYFNNGAVDGGEIDAIELGTGKETGNRPLFVYKLNTSETYMNQ